MSSFTQLPLLHAFFLFFFSFFLSLFLPFTMTHKNRGGPSLDSSISREGRKERGRKEGEGGRRREEEGGEATISYNSTTVNCLISPNTDISVSSSYTHTSSSPHHHPSSGLPGWPSSSLSSSARAPCPPHTLASFTPSLPPLHPATFSLNS